MRFVANLRQETIDAFAAQAIQPAAYLLSSHRVSPSTLRAAAVVRDLQLPLFADNGTKPLIDETIDVFAAPAKLIRSDVKKIRRKLGRVPRGADVPDELRRRAIRLANDVVDHATRVSAAIDAEALLLTQLSMAPTDLIAQEDFATACLVALDLERETTGWSVSRLVTRNRRSLRLWRRVARDPRCDGIRVHAVLSAMDYNSARAASSLAAAEGATHLALGIAGITRDPSAVDFYVKGRASFALARPVPRRYVRLAQVLQGFADGAAAVGGRIHRFHCLGLGAPAMLPLPPAALSEQTVLTTDATSPIHDAVRDRVLYDFERDGDRASTREIVQRIVEGGDWPFLSPFSRAFRDAFGHDPDAARAAWQAGGRPPVTRELLGAPGGLTAALPLFCEADPVIRIAASKSRIAHNHWVLGELCAGFPEQAGRHARAFAAIDARLSRPESVTTRGLAAALQVLERGGT